MFELLNFRDLDESQVAFGKGLTIYQIDCKNNCPCFHPIYEITAFSEDTTNLKSQGGNS